MGNPDQAFFDRADGIINLANEQMEQAKPGETSASLMYATARFNAFVTSINNPGSAAMKAARDETIGYFLQQYRLMLEENLDDYIEMLRQQEIGDSAGNA